MTRQLLGIKRENGWTWKHICAEIGGMSSVLVTAKVRTF
jgi:cyanate lyase